MHAAIAAKNADVWILSVFIYGGKTLAATFLYSHKNKGKRMKTCTMYFSLRELNIVQDNSAMVVNCLLWMLDNYSFKSLINVLDTETETYILHWSTTIGSDNVL